MSNFEHLIPEFLKAMDEIGRYGSDKYGAKSFQHRRGNDDRSRGELTRCQAGVILHHSREHCNAYLRDEKHDHFGTLRHQLAAAAFNAMMEFYFAGLDKER